MEVILLLIVAVGVIALIYISKKRKELDEEPIPTPDKPDADSTKTTTIKTPIVVVQPEEKEPSDPLQNTIYKYAARRGNRCCPFCDGENRAGDVVCKICGQDM